MLFMSSRNGNGKVFLGINHRWENVIIFIFYNNEWLFVYDFGSANDNNPWPQRNELHDFETVDHKV